MTSFHLAIPSKGRCDILKKQTLKTLELAQIPIEIITIFVVPDEETLYRTTFPNYNVVVGVPGIVQQRQFIERYYPEGAHIVFMDDDIKSIDLSLMFYYTLKDFILDAFSICKTEKAYIWGVYPVFNKFYREKQSQSYSTCLNHIVGCFYGIINRHDKDLEISIAKCAKEDVERSIRYFIKDGRVIRFNRIGYDTKYYNPVGGIGNKASRQQSNKDDTLALADAFPIYGKVKQRKDETYEFKLNKIAELKTTIADELAVTVLPPADISEFIILYEMLNSITHPMKKGDSNRRGFAPHRASVWGITKYRFTNEVGLSAISKAEPDIYQEIIRVGKLICPFDFTAIHVNHNVTCPPHKDDTNVGKSVLVSIGEYDGCNIVIDGKQYDTFCQPVMFNGALLEHWNTDNLVGNKFSLVFYNSPYAERLGVTKL